MGSQTAYVQADALQDQSSAQKSGFNAITVDFSTSLQQYYHFQWRSDRYSAVVYGEELGITLEAKQPERLAPTTRFLSSIQGNTFGFTHCHRGAIQLADVFVYPILSTSQPGQSKPTQVRRNGVLTYLLAEKRIYLYGQDRSGKSSILKTLFPTFSLPQGDSPCS